MTDQEMQIAIAEACRWRVVGPDSRDHSVYDGDLYPFSLRGPDGKFMPKIYATKEAAWNDAPDYLNDLNAMACAEDTLSDEQWDIYSTWLCITTDYKASRLRAHELIRAKASQRAEAFLRTIGKWKEEVAA